MLMALNQYGEMIQAKDATNGVYSCPVCMQRVTLKKGRVNIAHFSHQRIMDCLKTAYKKESLAHLKGKHSLYNLCRDQFVVLEYYISDIVQIPDVYVNNSVALELQLSVISPALIESRTLGYNSLGSRVVWICNDERIQVHNGLHLSQFLRSMIDYKTMTLWSYNVSRDLFYKYILTGLNSHLNYHYRKEVVRSFDDFSSTNEFYMVPIRANNTHYIKHCLNKRSVLEPTLSQLYQLHIHWNDLPDHLGIVIASQRFVKTHPLEWQSKLLLALKDGQKDPATLLEGIQLHPCSTPVLSKSKLMIQLIEEYYSAVKDKIRAN